MHTMYHIYLTINNRKNRSNNNHHHRDDDDDDDNMLILFMDVRKCTFGCVFMFRQKKMWFILRKIYRSIVRVVWFSSIYNIEFNQKITIYRSVLCVMCKKKIVSAIQSIFKKKKSHEPYIHQTCMWFNSFICHICSM